MISSLSDKLGRDRVRWGESGSALHMKSMGSDTRR